VADVRILLISGSTRRGSGNTAALRTVQALAPDGITAEMYDGLAALPAFSPDQDERPPGPAADLRARIAAVGALLFCTPEYAGTLPGSLKNLLDWTVGGGEIYGKPVGWVNVAVGGRGTGAEDHLAMVLRYVGAVVRPRARPAGGGRAGRDHHRPRDPNGPRSRSHHPGRGSHPARSVDQAADLAGIDRGSRAR
jgi:chromate reductase